MKTKVMFLLLSMLFVYPLFADIDFTYYHNLTQVYNEMENLETTYPSLAKIISIGTSVEGRAIKALKISDNVATNETNEGDFIIVAAHHAREWITIETALYIAEYLLKNYSTNAALQADINNLEIWIVPVLNPDGVLYTWDVYRYWRKNRRNNGDGTHGVDLNRNWGYEWGHADGVYTSSVSSDDTYMGPYAFSEPEIVYLRNHAQNVDNLKAFLTYHSYSELVLRPWSYTTDDAPGESTLQSIVARSIDLIASVHGHTYGDSIWYVCSGEATDWFWGEKRVAPFTVECRPKCLSTCEPTCCGLSGFSPPASTIIPNNEENLPAVLALIHDAGSRELWIRDYPGDTGYEPSAEWTGTGWTHAFWISPDIWTVPEILDQGAVVDLYVRVHNNTGVTKTNVQVDAYWTDPRISLEMPNLDAHLIDSQTVTVPPGGTTLTMSWTVPIGTNIWGERHWCVGAVIKHSNDMPLTTQSERTSNIAVRNFATTEVVAGSTILFAATNYLSVAAELQVIVDKKQLPEGWQVFLPPRPGPRYGIDLPTIARKAKLLGAEGILLEPGQTIVLPVRVEAPPNAKQGTWVEVKLHGALVPLVAGKRTAVGNGFTYKVVVKECKNK